MKKFLCVLLGILLVCAAAAGAGYGIAWYQSNHVYVGGDAYYIYETELDLREKELSIADHDDLQTLLPDCRITWLVPFQGKKVDSSSEKLTVTTLTGDDLIMLQRYFPNLKELDASAIGNYPLLEECQAVLPRCKVLYQVDLGGKAFAPDTQELTLDDGEYTLETLTENLKHLPQLASLRLTTPELSLEEIRGLEQAYENVDITCTVEILGQEYSNDTTSLDLSTLTGDQVAAVVEKLAFLPQLAEVNLMDAQGNSILSKEQARDLMVNAPQATVKMRFELFGQQLSTDTEEVVFTDVAIGDAGEAELRMALDLMPNCKRFVLDNCKLSNEVLAKLRDDYRDRTKIVWRIWFATRGTCLTDVEIFRCVGNLEKNYASVKYCEDVLYMDIGHCNGLWDIEFTAYMPKLKALIASGTSIDDISPLKNCKELEFLELSFDGHIKDISALKECTGLRMLNIVDIKLKDLSPLDDLRLVYMNARHYEHRNSYVPKEEQERFIQKHPGCYVSFDNSLPIYAYWRYEADNKTYTPYYHMLRQVFRYDLDPNDPKQAGMYVADIDGYLQRLHGEGAPTFDQYVKAVEDSWVAWEQHAKEAEEAARLAAEAAAAEAAENPEATTPADETKTDNP